MLDSHWAQASMGRGRSLWAGEPIEPCRALCDRDHIPVISLLFNCRLLVPRQIVYHSQNWYMWFCGRFFCNDFLCWLYVDSCLRSPSGLCDDFGSDNVTEFGFGVCSSQQLFSWQFALACVCCFGFLQQIGEQSRIYCDNVCDLLAVYVSRLDVAYGVGVVNRALMPSLVSCLPPCTMLNHFPQMLRAKNYGCITLAIF